MKPWEETWDADIQIERLPLHTNVRRDDGAMIADVVPLDIPPREVANAKLIAAAPDMARALLAVEWGGRCADYGNHCPSCLGDEPFVDVTGVKRHGGHTEDCALDAALRKAGVR